MIIKGKRSKRQRPLSQPSLSTSSSTAEAGGFFSESVISGGSVHLPATPGQEEEEEEMAKCLILLANNGRKTECDEDEQQPRAGTRLGDANNVYQCKTCNKCFSSFQALGGHRAGHKIKPKTQETSTLVRDHDTNLSLRVSNTFSPQSKKCRVHECSICGAEFSSGQALGGHMRRHRAILPNAYTIVLDDQAVEPTTQKMKKSRGDLLSLDLNLPAEPEEDDEEEEEEEEYSNFSYASKEQVLVFSASPNLVIHCHN